MKRNTTLCIFIVTLALVSIGTVMVYSSSAATAAYHDRLMIYRKAPELLEKTNHYHDADYLKKQLIWVVLGVMAMLICYNVDYARLGKYSPYILGIAVLLLIAVLIFGVRINGAKRWLRVGMFTIQPSEFAKLALVIFMSRFLAEHKNKVKSFLKGFLPVLSILGATLVLVILEPDLGSTAVIGAIIFIIWFVAGLRILHLSSLFIASIPCGLVAIFKWRYQLDRIIAFTNPWKYRDGIGFQMVQAQIAVGTGGLHGHGLGAGMQKYQFLAEAHTDYIFAILAEETGFIGGVFLVILFVALLYLGMTVALRASDYYPGLLASGIVTMICLSSAVNFFVVLSMLPPKGLALPFISYGGSSLFVNMAAIGILLNISKSTEEAALAAMPR